MPRLSVIPGTVLLFAAGACQPQHREAPQEERAHPVETVRVRAEPSRDQLTLIGKTEPWRETVLYFEVPGIVAEVMVNEGDSVRPGDTIAQLVLDDYQLAVSRAQSELEASRAGHELLLAGTRKDDLEAARADYAAAEARAKYWESELGRAEQLFRTKTITDSERDRVREQNDAAMQAKRAAKARLDRAIAGPRNEEIAAAAADGTFTVITNATPHTVNVASLSIRHPRALSVAVFTATVCGVLALWTMPRREDPPLTWRLANVVTRLPGTSATRVEAQITDVLERQVEEVDEVEHIYSVSRPGVSLLQIELNDGETRADRIWQKVRDKLAEARSELLVGVAGPDLDDEIMGTSTLVIAIASDSATYRTLKDYADTLENQLRYLPTTASTTLFGAQREIIHVELDPAKLAAYDLTFDSVASALRNRNTRQPSGRLRVQGSELVIEASGEVSSEDELAGIVLLVTSGGHTLRLGDVATVRRSTSDPPDPVARANGMPAVVVAVRARSDARIDTFGVTVQKVLDGFRGTLPDDIQCVVVHDESTYTT